MKLKGFVEMVLDIFCKFPPLFLTVIALGLCFLIGMAVKRIFF